VRNLHIYKIPEGQSEPEELSPELKLDYRLNPQMFFIFENLKGEVNPELPYEYIPVSIGIYDKKRKLLATVLSYRIGNYGYASLYYKDGRIVVRADSYDTEFGFPAFIDVTLQGKNLQDSIINEVKPNKRK
jgi:hypothetical protein